MAISRKLLLPIATGVSRLQVAFQGVGGCYWFMRQSLLYLRDGGEALLR
jgi:hypothetical protein